MHQAGREARTLMASSPPARSRYLGTRTGVAGQHPSEIVRSMDGSEPRSRVVQEQQGPELGRRCAPEQLRRPRDVGPTELPQATHRAALPGGVDRIEVGPRRGVHAVRTGVPVAGPAEVGSLDPRQVGLERHAAVVLPPTERRTREQDRTGVERCIEAASVNVPGQVVW